MSSVAARRAVQPSKDENTDNIRIKRNARRRRSYARRCRGRTILAIEADYHDTIRALLAASEAAVRAGLPPRLSEAESLDRGKVEAAVAEVVAEWVGIWLKK
jgi:hypothetical protein